MDCASTHNNHPTTHAARAQAALWRQVELLETLAETGVKLAQAIAEPVIEAPITERKTAEAPVERPEQVAMAFARVARAVRMTALLQSRLIKDMDEARGRHDYEHRAALFRDEQAAAADARQDPARGHKARVEAIVARVARSQGEDEEEVERIAEEAGERLDDDDIYGDVMTRSVGELVALVCRDLNLEPDWSALGQEAWAIREGITARGPPSSPLPLDGVLEIACDFDGQAGSGRDASPIRNAQLPSHPHPQPFPHQGGREPPGPAPPPPH